MSNSKKTIVERSHAEIEEEGPWGEHLDIDLNRSTVVLDEDGQQAIKLARQNLMALLDMVSGSVPPEPDETWVEWVHEHLRYAIYMRNVVRGVFLKSEGYELPEKWERLEGTVH